MVKFIGLKVSGIRSIGETPQCIDFLAPLTIIQGANGTGKTTIIEALNYVTTGALPAGKMQTFIHNNQIANKSRVDALVQLVFTDIKGNKCTATKRMNASAGRTGKLTTKSDEFTLKITDKFGNPKSISSKVADFNKEMLNLLGVPKAILEYVLFCHQEESNWPLSEPKELKMRFDAIFEVTKYVKALDNIKKNIKELNIQIQLVDKELPHLLNNVRGRADLRMKYDETLGFLRQNKRSIDQLKEEKESIERELLGIRKQLEGAIKNNHEFEVIQGQINIQARFLEGLPPLEFNGTRDQLKQQIDEFRYSATAREADEYRSSVVRQIQSIALDIKDCKRAEEECRTQIVHQNSKQMLLKTREDEYTALLEHYSIKYEIPVDSNLVENLRLKVTKLEWDRADFVETKGEQIKELSESIEKLRAKAAELRNNSQSKRQECAKLSQSIAAAEREFRTMGSTTQIVDKLTQSIVKWEAELRTLSDFTLLDDIWQALRNLQADMNTLRMDLMELGHDESQIQMTRDKASKSLEKAGDKLDATMTHIGTLKRRVQISSQLAEYKDRKAAASEKLIQLETIKQSIGEKSEQIRELEQLAAAAGQELPGIETELRTMEADKQELERVVQRRERQTAMDIDAIGEAIVKINDLREANERDRQSQRPIGDVQEKLEEQKARLEGLLDQKSQLEKQLEGAESKKHELRQMEDQLRRMDVQEQLERYKRQLDEAKENATISGTENLAELRKKEQRTNHRAVEVNNLIHQKNGEQTQLRKRMEDLRHQLEEPRYADARKQYMDKMVERSITSASIEDLEQYYKVVDNAIINFHQQKMEQINQILQELWTRVYQGNDIETIKIKSLAVSGAEKKKSYDYSVVMTVDQTDVDMRDRCSAGQKVLASILIRIALADVFAGNCRILALDEPTTNLDADKVENIGTMLKSLIELKRPTGEGGGAIGARHIFEAEDDDFERTTVGEEVEVETTTAASQEESNRSLQLIVITHDRRLVEHLHLACRPDYIYGLSKDENGVSRIKAYSQVAADLEFFA